MVPGIVGEILGIEVIRMAVENKSALEGYLLTMDTKNMGFRKMKLRNRKEECLSCGKDRLIPEEYDYYKYDGCKIPTNLPNVPNMTWEEYIEKKGSG